MMQELRKARRELAELKLRRVVCAHARLHSVAEANACSRMARDLARQIKRQELEVRRMMCETGVYRVRGGTVIRIYVGCVKQEKRYEGRNAYTRAIAWAERQNRKVGGE